MLPRVAQQRNDPERRRRAYVHIGTHKTGTTAIQTLLALNEDRFASAGVLLPRTGRTDPALAAQHNIAYYLTHNPLYHPANGTYLELGAEIAGTQADAICLSSEEFGSLAVNRGGMLSLFAGLNESVDCEPRIIIYLRPQVDIIESLFAELVKHDDPPSFRTFFETIVSTGHFDESQLVYTKLLDAFAERFGAHRMIVRPYVATSDSTALLRDFVRIVAPEDFDFDALALPPRVNQRLPFESVLARMHDHDDWSSGQQPFEPLTLADIALVVSRFAPDNVRLRRRYGVFIPPISPARLHRATMRALRPAAPGESQRRELAVATPPSPRTDTLPQGNVRT